MRHARCACKTPTPGSPPAGQPTSCCGPCKKPPNWSIGSGTSPPAPSCARAAWSATGWACSTGRKCRGCAMAPEQTGQRSLFAAQALLPGGRARNLLVQWDAAGAGAAARLLPGLPNLHSHAFQRAFAGLAEYRAERQDSFWSWRQLMYRFAAHITPGQMQAIATWLYVEMLEAGYTRVCEFHYLHHNHTGQPYADDARMSLALLHAARTAGIGITLLPALYQSSGFGAQPPHAQQARFIRSTASMLSLLERLRPIAQAQGAVLGLALHSLRAV